MGVPKALLRDESGVPWGVRTARLLGEAGCDPVVVVLGAAVDDVRAHLLHEAVQVVHAPDWAEGMGASLRAGLRHLAGTSGTPEADAALVCVVDTPGLNLSVVRRLAALARPDALVRATYDGVPGHPVVLGSRHLRGVADTAHGDVGARDYLRRHPDEVQEVECSDLATGADVDTPADLPPGHRLG